MDEQYYVYIMANYARTIYVGVTSNLERRVREHKDKSVPGFTSRYGLTSLVYYEVTGNIEAAIMREKQVKGWLRSKKVALIESMNPEWRDISEDWLDSSIEPDCHSEGVGRPKNPCPEREKTDPSLRSG